MSGLIAMLVLAVVFGLIALYCGREFRASQSRTQDIQDDYAMLIALFFFGQFVFGALALACLAGFLAQIFLT